MGELKSRIDFLGVIMVQGANPNGDPDSGNRPRQDFDGYGLITDVCLKRKIRNRLQTMGHPILVQSDDRADDGYSCIKDRAEAKKDIKFSIPKRSKAGEAMEAERQIRMAACQEWIDVRAFGSVFAFSGPDSAGVSIGIRGPVSIGYATSLEPVTIRSTTITKSTNSTGDMAKGRDTMGKQQMVERGVYTFFGSIHPQLARATGFSTEDADAIHEAILTMFDGDASGARPSGSMELQKLYWWSPGEKDQKYSPLQIKRSVQIDPQEEYPYYRATVHRLPGSSPTVFDALSVEYV